MTIKINHYKNQAFDYSYCRKRKGQSETRRFLILALVLVAIGLQVYNNSTLAKPETIDGSEEKNEAVEPPSIVGELPKDIGFVEQNEIPAENTENPKEYAKSRVIEVWGESQWEAFEDLVQKESSWITGNVNKQSGACGLGQAYPCSKYTSKHVLGDFRQEIDWMIDYITGRYGTPQSALHFWLYKAIRINGENWY